MRKQGEFSTLISVLVQYWYDLPPEIAVRLIRGIRLFYKVPYLLLNEDVLEPNCLIDCVIDTLISVIDGYTSSRYYTFLLTIPHIYNFHKPINFGIDSVLVRYWYRYLEKLHLDEFAVLYFIAKYNILFLFEVFWNLTDLSISLSIYRLIQSMILTTT